MRVLSSVLKFKGKSGSCGFHRDVGSCVVHTAVGLRLVCTQWTECLQQRGLAGVTAVLSASCIQAMQVIGDGWSKRRHGCLHKADVVSMKAGTNKCSRRTPCCSMLASAGDGWTTQVQQSYACGNTVELLCFSTHCVVTHVKKPRIPPAAAMHVFSDSYSVKFRPS